MDSVALSTPVGTVRFFIHALFLLHLATFCRPLRSGRASICWRLRRDAPSVLPFNTGIPFIWSGIGVLPLPGRGIEGVPCRARTPDASAILYEKYWKLNGGGMECLPSNRAEMLSNSLLALGAVHGWQLAGMMLLGAAPMRGWLKGQRLRPRQLSPYRSAGGVRLMINLPAVIFTMAVDRAYRWCLLLQAPQRTERAVANAGLCRADVWLAAASRCRDRRFATARVGRMALTTIRCRRSSSYHTVFYQFGLFMKIQSTGTLVLSFRYGHKTLLFRVIWLRFWRQDRSSGYGVNLTLRARQRRS